MTETIHSREITDQVTLSLTDQVEDFDIAAIVADIIAEHGLVAIDDIDDADYWGIVARHAR